MYQDKHYMDFQAIKRSWPEIDEDTLYDMGARDAFGDIIFDVVPMVPVFDRRKVQAAIFDYQQNQEKVTQ